MSGVVNQSSYEDLQEQITEIKQEIVDLEIRQKDLLFEKYETVVNNSQAIISNGLQSQSHILEISGIILAILGILLGIYIRYLWKKVEYSKKAVDKIEKDTKRYADDIENNIEKIYQDILNEETKYIFDRIKNIPEEISHFASKLATRNIPNQYKDLLISLFSKSPINTNKRNYQGIYFILIFQHFPQSVFLKEELFQYLKDNSTRIMNKCYSNEIVAITKSLEKLYIQSQEQYKSKRETFVQGLLYYVQQCGSEELRKKLIDNSSLDDLKHKLTDIDLSKVVKK